MKTDEEIKTELFRFIRSSPLMEAVTGSLSKTKRPKDSILEDVVISIKSNENGENQIAYANVHVYTKGKRVDRQVEEDTTRLTELCRMCADLFDVFRPVPEARCTLNTQRIMAVDGTDEYLINNEIKYRITNE